MTNTNPLVVYYGSIVVKNGIRRITIPVIYASRKGDESTFNSLRDQLLDGIMYDSVEYFIRPAPPDFIQKVALDNTFHL